MGPLDSTSWERKDGRKVCTPTIGYAVPGYASSRTCVCVCVCGCTFPGVHVCTWPASAAQFQNARFYVCPRTCKCTCTEVAWVWVTRTVSLHARQSASERASKREPGYVTEHFVTANNCFHWNPAVLHLTAAAISTPSRVVFKPYYREWVTRPNFVHEALNLPLFSLFFF